MVDLPTPKVVATWQGADLLNIQEGTLLFVHYKLLRLKSSYQMTFFHQATYFQLVLNAENYLVSLAIKSHEQI